MWFHIANDGLQRFPRFGPRMSATSLGGQTKRVGKPASMSEETCVLIISYASDLVYAPSTLQCLCGCAGAIRVPGSGTLVEGNRGLVGKASGTRFRVCDTFVKWANCPLWG